MVRDSRHSFGAFKDVMYDYSLIVDDWYSYREGCYRAYVRHELDLAEDVLEWIEWAGVF